MKTEEIARKLVAYCRDGKWEQAQQELYASNAVSIEQEKSPMFEKETRGLAAIREKGKKWDAMVEKLHSNKVSEPIVTDNVFACTATMDVTMKGRGRTTMSELCVYQVKDDKIVAEEFFM